MSLFETWENIRQQAPLIHHITNYVTVNDVANITLACGASPVMADDIDEAAEITTLASGLCLNIGTLSQRTIPAMISAARQASKLHHPIVLDPVGAGASYLRTQTAQKLLTTAPITCIRGNISEIKTLVNGAGITKGVDAAAVDCVTAENLAESCTLAKQAANSLKTIVAITGAIDLVADEKSCYVIRNGRPEMSRITGTGCQCSAIVAACIAANPAQPLSAAATAVTAMGLAGEIAYSYMQPEDGNATYRNRIIDTICRLTASDLKKGAQYEIH
ncbi:hydroxyethylthiazole kinase [Selenomonas ruminantium]|uniref:Hydroxyethylthiazole kinase n=1 Tax=Selenomonas ruminantium TaxID=971 RepID=A0A1M6T5V1_SELRU|nr:hydroxyethylthiazole kinase [Selenomonas ruminantium]SHK52347.1 hydroxyethylthiazole kinase [Selenomonas ruminantium]